jgi:hypothetical protein
MLNLDPGVDFEPSKTTKALWKWVRHGSFHVAGISVPGLFDITHFPLDCFAFTVVVALEAWGLVNFLRVGRVQLIFVVGLFLADLAFAILAHYPRGGICLRSNQLVYEYKTENVARLRKHIGRGRLYSRVFATFIILIALFKIGSFIGLAGQFNGLVLAIVVSYAIAAVLHIISTGYFLYAILAQLFLWANRNQFDAAPADENVFRIVDARPHKFDSTIALSTGQVDKHNLEQRDGHYILNTWGVLTDRQVQAFCLLQQERDAKSTVVQECVQTQLHIMENEIATQRKAADSTATLAAAADSTAK